MQSDRLPWKQAFDVLEKGINAEGVHTYPFDPTLPIDVAFFVHAGRDHVRMNRHTYFEVIYVYNGTTDIQIVDRSFQVKRGDLLVIGPNLYHRVVNQPNSEVKLVSLNFDANFLRTGGSAAEDEQYLLPFFCQSEQFPHEIPRSACVSEAIRELIFDIHDELPANSRLSRLAVITYLKMLLLLLCKHYSDYLESRKIFDWKQRNIERLAPLFEFIEHNFERPIQVAEAARICAMSSSHFMSFFKKTTGESFIAYLNNFRIAKAQVLLSATNDPIAKISARLAFCSQSYFGKVFHMLVGMTPLTYRERFGHSSQASPIEGSPEMRNMERVLESPYKLATPALAPRHATSNPLSTV
jgi:AraC-like DNA-binding protein